MAEYYPLLERAVAGMRDGPPEQRRAIYDRARQALLGQLRSMQPAVPEASIHRESSALDEAIARLEATIITPAASAATEPVEVAPAPAPLPPSAKTLAPVTGTPPRPGPSRPGTEALDRIRSEPTTAPILRATRDEGEFGSPALGTVRPSPLPSAPVLQVPTFADATDLAESGAAGDATSASAADTPLAAREEPLRPPAPRPIERKRFNPRFLILALVGSLVVAGIAYAAWRLRDKPELLAKSKAAQAAAQQAEQQSAKVSTRADGSPTAPSPVAAVVPTLTPLPAAVTSPTLEPAAAPSRPATAQSETAAPPSAPTAAPSVNPAPAPEVAAADTMAPGAPAADAIAVAQRAAFLVEAPDDPQKIKTFVGTMVWSTDNASPVPNQPIARTVHADVDIPEAGLKMTMVFQKNDEAQFPASHTLEIRFALQPGNTYGPIKQINMPMMRNNDSPQGDPLIGLPVTITDNYFLVGLSRGESVARNLDLIKTRNWFDVPLLLASGKVAKITFEKGTPGTKAIDEVIQSWQ